MSILPKAVMCRVVAKVESQRNLQSFDESNNQGYGPKLGVDML